MQYRPLAHAEAESVSAFYPPTSFWGGKNEPVHTLNVQWTNDSPVGQWVYGMVTRSGAQVTLQARSRAYLAMSQGVAVGDAESPPPIDMEVVSRFGNGWDIGKGGILALGTSFGVHSISQNSCTAPLMPRDPGWWYVAPGETFFARVEVRFISEFWENTLIDGGGSGAESGFVSGETALDLFGIPAMTPPEPRPTPSVVGVEHGVGGLGAATSVDVPSGTTEGDVILAIVTNQFGIGEEILPQQAGWTMLHAVNDGFFGVGDVHMRIFGRVATDAEPASYGFTNGFLAEEIAHLVTIRDAEPDFAEGWHFASTMRRFIWERWQGHICPSIDMPGGLLLCGSYFAHSNLQSPITQTQPEGMTELSDVPVAGSTCALAALSDPPRPTLARVFVPSTVPQVSGRSISLSVLVPGREVTV
ncbi:hypothetical protein H7I53_17860 [Mycolicibacterium pulveris]|nr:hypothetical protein [Mycolicibacterium pulveris]